MNIDAKDDAAVAPLVEVIERAGTGAHDRVCVAAFSDPRLRQFRRLSGGKVCTAMGPRTIARLKGAGYRAPTWPFAAGCVQVPLYTGGSASSTAGSWPPPTGGDCMCTCGRSTSRRRWTASSTWASTGS